MHRLARLQFRLAHKCYRTANTLFSYYTYTVPLHTCTDGHITSFTVLAAIQQYTRTAPDMTSCSMVRS
uniref:Uncharacterized protein n=1 Tax=Zea mays TaxID=4577 RepID=C4J761_MAIZE|nr:unknown [Zea mays]